MVQFGADIPLCTSSKLRQVAACLSLTVAASIRGCRWSATGREASGTHWYTGSRQMEECNGHQRSRQVSTNRRSARLGNPTVIRGSPSGRGTGVPVSHLNASCEWLRVLVEGGHGQVS